MMKLILFLILFTGFAANAVNLDFLMNGVPKVVKVDTVTPANSVPYPMQVFNTSGSAVNLGTEATLSAMSAKLPAALGQTTMSGSLSVTMASNQTAITVSAPSWPLPSGAATEATLSTLNGKIPSNLTVTSTRLLVDGSGVTQPISGTVTANAGSGTFAVSAASLPLPSGAATESTLTANGVLLGAVNESAPGTDTASSGLNGRLQRIAQRLTSLIALFPTSLGQKTMANSFAVTLASDQSSIPTTPGVKAAVTAKQAAITVGTSAVRATTDGSAPSSTRQRLEFMQDPDSTATCYYGSSSVTTSSTTRGVRLFPGASKEFKDDANDYYIICDTASQTIFVVEAE